MSNETKHTPTPWAAQKGADDKTYIWGRFSHNPALGEQHSYTVARIQENIDTIGGEAEANAAFIVRACNAHDELVAILKDLRDFTGDDEEAYNAVLNRYTQAEPNRYSHPGDVGVELSYRASAALAKARGEA